MVSRLIFLTVFGLANLGLTWLFLSGSLAFNAHITEDPAKLLKKYLSLDKKGARLEAYSTEVLQPYVAWKDEPVWGHVVIISDYQVIEDVNQWEILGALEAKIPVLYEVVGIMHWDSVTFVPELQNESHLFHIQAVHDRWQIVHPQLPPHVGRQRMVDFVRWAALQESDADKKAKLTSLRHQLEAERE